MLKKIPSCPHCLQISFLIKMELNRNAFQIPKKREINRLLDFQGKLNKEELRISPNNASLTSYALIIMAVYLALLLKKVKVPQL